MILQYTGQKFYELEVCGLTRQLPVVPVEDGLYIAAFVILGDTKLTNLCAAALASRIQKFDYDYIVGPEAKVIPLLQAMATLLSEPRYVVCRKSTKAYMEDAVSHSVKSITTAAEQRLVLDGSDVKRLRGKRVVIVDDVVSTGGTFRAVEALMAKVDAEVAGRATILKEGDAFDKPLEYLAPLPLFQASENEF